MEAEALIVEQRAAPLLGRVVGCLEGSRSQERKTRGNTKGKKKKKDKCGGKMQKRQKRTRNKGKKRGVEKDRIVFTGLSVCPSVGPLVMALPS